MLAGFNLCSVRMEICNLEIEIALKQSKAERTSHCLTLKDFYDVQIQSYMAHVLHQNYLHS